MENDRPRWERPRAERTGPARGGVADEYLKTGAVQAEIDPTQQGTAEGTQDTAYRVLNDYLKYSESLARARPGKSGGAELGQKRGPMDYRSLAVTMFETWTRFAEMWFQMLEQGVDLRQGAMPDLDAFVRPGAAAQSPGHAETPEQVTLAVSSRQPTQARVTLKPGVFSSDLVAHALRATADGLPAIPATVEIDHIDGIVVRIDVPDNQPSGAYSGLLIDVVTDQPRGDVSLRVRESS